MNAPHSADLTWDEHGQPISRAFNDRYFPVAHALDASRQLFLQGNQLPQRWQQLASTDSFTIAETGFGSGLNFLSTWQSWQMHAPNRATLHFISVEKYPLLRHDLERALQLWPELAPLSQQLIEQYPAVDARGFHRLHFGNVQLTLIYADAAEGLAQCLAIEHPGPHTANSDCGWGPFGNTHNRVNTWFLNGFAAANNPQMWHPALFEVIARLSEPGTTFASSSATDAVCLGLQAFNFSTREGLDFNGKRTVLYGECLPPRNNGTEHLAIPAQANAPPSAVNRSQRKRRPSPSWHLCQKAASPPTRVAVIGAGLAGCHSAYALAQRGFAVTLIDRGDIASGASGNPQGVVYSKLSSSAGSLADFNIAAFTYAARFYTREGLYTRCGAPCGVLQLPGNATQAEQQRTIAAEFQQSPELVQWLDRERASAAAGVSLPSSALWLPQAGWLDPPLLCKTLTEHPNIRVVRQREVHKLSYLDGQWQLADVDGLWIATAEAAIIACADSARRFSQCSLLPSKAIRGQISFVPATTESAPLKAILCGEGYVAPARDGQHCLGASFNLTLQTTQNRWDEHRSNLHQVRKLAPAFSNLAVAELGHGRTSMRCTTPDYLPLVGPVAHESAMLERFARYRRNAKAIIDAPGHYWPGLFTNIGHGSKGLTYTPLCAELLACMITNQPLPLSRHLALHLHSARFLIRDLARRRL